MEIPPSSVPSPLLHIYIIHGLHQPVKITLVQPILNYPVLFKSTFRKRCRHFPLILQNLCVIELQKNIQFRRPVLHCNLSFLLLASNKSISPLYRRSFFLSFSFFIKTASISLYFFASSIFSEKDYTFYLLPVF